MQFLLVGEKNWSKVAVEEVEEARMSKGQT
jgi:hypothetical protein